MKKSVVLVVVLGVILIVTALAYVAIAIMTQESRLAEHKIKRMRAFYAAQAGLNHNLELLRRNIPMQNISVGAGIAGYPSSGYQVAMTKVDNAGISGTHKISAKVDY